MLTYYKIRHNLFSNKLLFAGLLMSFLAFSIFSDLILIWTHKIHINGDLFFHWQQIFELIKSNKVLPQVAFNSFASVGSAVISLYPYIFLYSFAFIFRLTGSIIFSMYIMFSINMFLILVISFFSSLLFSRNALISYIFSLMYSICIFSSSFISCDIGITYSYIFMPLIIFGSIYLLKYGRWIMLSIGVSMIIYSNVMASFLTIIFVGMFFIYNYKTINRIKILNLTKAIFLTFCTTALFTIPMLRLLFFNKLNTPTISGRIHGMGFGMIRGILLPTPSFGMPVPITIYAFIGIFIGLIFFKFMSKILRGIYILSLVTLFLGSKLLPWQILGNKINFIKTIQYPGRMYMIPVLILTYILAKYIVYMFQGRKYVPLLIVLLSIMGITVINQSLFIRHFKMNYIRPINVEQPHYGTNASYEDYYPKRALIYKKYLLSRSNNLINFNSIGKGKFICYTGRNFNSLQLPLLYYRGINYNIKINNRYVRIHHRNNLIVLKDIKKGVNDVQILIKLNLGILISRVLFIISMFVYIKLIIRKLIDKAYEVKW